MPARRPTRFEQLVRSQLPQVRGRLLLAAVCMVGLTLTELARPWPLKIIFDQILSDKPLPALLSFLEGTLQGGKLIPLVVISSTIVVIALIKALLSYYQTYITSRVGNQIVYAIRRELFSHVQRLSLSFHNRAGSGELLTKIASDTNMVKDIFAESAVAFTLHVLTIVGMLAVMLALNWKLGLIVLATFPILLWNVLYRYRKVKVSAKRVRKNEEKLATRISEVLTAVPLVQAFGRARYETERFESESSRQLEESIRGAQIEAIAARAVEIITAFSTFAVVLFGSWQVLEGQMTVGSVVVFAFYLRSLYSPVRNLAKLSARFSRATVSAQRITEVLEVEPEIQDRPDAVEASSLKGEIVFENVCFDYGDGKIVLKDLSFAVSPGQRVVLVGVSGAGKSTLVSLILRLYDPREGSISIDGVDLRDYQHESLRGEIGIVLQESILFGASIKENIAYGKLDATMDEIVAAAIAANAHDFILDLEDGYETILGERGETLSGGQRQRIAIARALIRNAPILILDEPMTGLDVESEASILEALNRLMAGKTCLVITHDLRAAADADLVLVLEEGRIVERGSHEELMALGGRYRTLHGLRSAASSRELDEPVGVRS